MGTTMDTLDLRTRLGVLRRTALGGLLVAAIAIAWTLTAPAVTGAIVGARNPAQVNGWIDAATVELTGEDLREIEGVVVGR